MGIVQSPARPGTSKRPSAQMILKGLEQSIPAAEVDIGYRVGMGFLAGALFLLPLVYLGIMGLLVWGIVFELAHIGTIVQTPKGPMPIYALPLFLNTLVLLFLVKPLLMRGKESAETILTLRPAEEPVLFDFVGKLSPMPGASQPERIEVDCDANASARFHRGLLGLAGGRLVLRIGLPVAAGLTVREFAGVLAHELGHFTQRGGMGGSLLVRTMTYWFAQVVFRRDKLDEKLLAWKARAMEGQPGALLRCDLPDRERPRDPVAAADDRRGPDVRRDAPHGVRCRPLRSAGRRDHRVRPHRKDSHLPGRCHARRRLRPGQVLGAATARRRPPPPHRSQRQAASGEAAGQRAGGARRAGDPLVRHASLSCRSPCGGRGAEGRRLAALRFLGDVHLLRLSRLCRKASVLWYQHRLEGQFSPASLVATPQLVEEQLAQREVFRGLRRFFQGHIARAIMPGTGAEVPPADVASATQRLAAARDAMVAAAPGAVEVAKAYSKASSQLHAVRAGVAFWSIFNMPKVAAKRQACEKDIRRHQKDLARTIDQLNEFEEQAQVRLTLALSLLQNLRVGERLPAGRVPEARAAALKWIDAARCLDASRPTVDAVRGLVAQLRFCLNVHKPDEPYAPSPRR